MPLRTGEKPAAFASNASGDEWRRTLDALRLGDPSAIAECYHRHANPLHTLAWRLTGSREDAEDIVHDVFVGLPEALARYEERGQFAAWLSRITLRMALMRQRRAAHDRLEVGDQGPGQAEAISHTPVGDAALAARIMTALRRLTPPLRHVFILRALYENTHVEIAAALDISVSASEVRYHRAIRQLRQSLSDLEE